MRAEMAKLRDDILVSTRPAVSLSVMHRAMHRGQTVQNCAFGGQFAHTVRDKVNKKISPAYEGIHTDTLFGHCQEGTLDIISGMCCYIRVRALTVATYVMSPVVQMRIATPG